MRSSTPHFKKLLHERLAYPLQAGKSFGKRFMLSEIPLRASALAYHTLLAVVPVIGLVFLYLKKIGVTRKWFEKIQTFILQNINVSSNDDFMRYFTKLTASVSGRSVGMVGFAIFVYTAYSLVVKLGNSFDFILNTSAAAPEFRRNFLMLTFRRFCVILSFPIVILVSIFVASWLKEDSVLRYVFRQETVGPWLARPLPLLIDTAGFFLVYQLVPQRPILMKESLRAAFVAAIFFEMGRVAVAAYSKQAILTQKLYGAFAVIPIFIIWVQFAWFIMLTASLIIRVPKDEALHFAPEATRSSP